MMAPTLAWPDRIFQMWQYSVGMKRLLLRSTKNDTFGTRIDVLFQNVKAIKLPTLLHGVTVDEARGDVVHQISQETGLLPDREVSFFVVHNAAYEGYIVAGVCVHAEDKGEHFDPSELWPDGS